MSRIGERFVRLKESGDGGLVCFLTAGDPNIETTRRIVLELEKAGADVIELGVPFSDPIADGSSIQASSMRALEAGVNIPAVLDLVRSIRTESEIPLVLMSYYNPVHKYGVSRFAVDASEAGVDGVIATDLTPEEAGEWKSSAEGAGIDTVFLLAPTSTDPRVKKVASMASGFIYCVSRTGVTGARQEMAHGVRELVERIRIESTLPVAVGFGISTPAHVRDVCEYADGAVVGSVLVDLIANQAGGETLFKNIREVVSALKAGTILR